MVRGKSSRADCVRLCNMQYAMCNVQCAGALCFVLCALCLCLWLSFMSGPVPVPVPVQMGI
jgi:hypothetical protein